MEVSGLGWCLVAAGHRVLCESILDFVSMCIFGIYDKAPHGRSKRVNILKKNCIFFANTTDDLGIYGYVENDFCVIL